MVFKVRLDRAGRRPGRWPRLAAAIAISLTLAACASDDRETDQTETAALVDSCADSVVIELTGRDSLSVFDLLKAGHDVDYRTTLSGIFVTAIDSVRSSADCFWIYSVNDTAPPVACDRWITVDGDRVKWHFRRMNQ